MKVLNGDGGVTDVRRWNDMATLVGIKGFRSGLRGVRDTAVVEIEDPRAFQ